MITTRAAPALFLAICGLFTAFGPALAEEAADGGKHWKFDVVNHGNDSVVEFRTQEEGEWSENWIDTRMEPGDTTTLDFETNEGKCTVRTQIRFTNGSYFDADVDYCKASTLEINNDTLVWK